MNNEEFDLRKIKLIVGLGNIGREYDLTRHNIGFEFLDKLSTGDFLEEKKLKSLVSSIKCYDSKIILAKPTTLMNSSGESVNLLMNYYKIKHYEILVVHDDLDIKLGEYKIQYQKGPKVHNGVNSIEDRISCDEFWRVRIGVDNRDPETKRLMSGAAYVLSKFKDDELIIAKLTIDKIVKDLAFFISGKEITDIIC